MKKIPIPKWMIKRLHVLYAQYHLDEDTRRNLIYELTDGRTSSTAGLTYAEAQYLAGYITGAAGTTLDDKALKRQRSAVLLRLQKIGIDTTDWNKVNAFLEDIRIAGKPFYKLDYGDRRGLIPKLEAILKKQTEKQTV